LMKRVAWMIVNSCLLPDIFVGSKHVDLTI